MADELAALNVEVAHHHYRATLAANGVKRGKLPPPLHLQRPRPWLPASSTRPPQGPRSAIRSDGRRHATTVAEVSAVLSAAIKRG